MSHETNGTEPNDWNPYSEWLAIPPSQTPPTHYRLLGVKEFETDADRIHRAALEQIARLRIHQTGEHVDVSQKLMNEVSLARVVLCDPVKKAEYDRQLRGGREPNAAGAAGAKSVAFEPPQEDEVDEAPSENDEAIVVEDRPTRSYQSRRLPGPFHTVVRAAIGTVAALGLLAAGLVAWNWVFKFDLPAIQPPPAAPKVIAIGSEAIEPRAVEADPSARQTTPPAPSPPAPLETPPATPPDDVRPDPILGIHTAWESNLREQPRGMARPFDQNHAFGRDGMTLRADRPGGRIVYLPIPKGDFRLLVKLGDVELPSPHDGFSVGVVDANADRTSACLRSSEGRWRLAVEKNGVAGANGALAPSPPGLWIEVRRVGDVWLALATGASDSSAVRVPIAAPPDAVALYVGLDCRTARPAKAVVAEARIETRDDSLAPLISQWPAKIEAPTGSARERHFAATVESDDDRIVALSFDFEDPHALAKWTGAADGETGRAKLLPNATVDFGPIRNVRSFEWKAAFMERSTEFRIDSDDGPSVLVGAERSDARIGDAVVARFDPNDADPVQVEIYGVNESGAVELNPALDRAMRLPVGRPTLHVEAGDIQLEEFKITAEFDFERLWLRRLGDGEPGQVDGSYELVRRLYRWPGEFDLKPGDVRPVAMANTPDDEDAPFLSASGRDLFFRRTAAGKARIHCVRRRDPSEWFDFETILIGQDPNATPLSVALSPDETVAWILAEVDGATGVYESRRESPAAPFDPPKRIHSLTDASGESKPVVIADGLALLYSNEDSSGRRLIESTRGTLDEKFSPGRSVGVDGAYAHPTLTADALTMYVEGPGEEGKSAIFRTSRASPEASWGKPEPVPGLDSSTARRGDFSPFVTPDGEYLYFASDRDGGVGGLDLWVARLSRAAPEPAAPPHARRSGFWLTLGPVDVRDSERNKPLAVLKKYFPTRDRRSPPKSGDLMHGKAWEWSDSLSRGPGLYLVAHPFRVHDPVLNAAVEVVNCPGGAYFWFNGLDVKFGNKAGLGQIEPWQPLSSGPVSQTSDSLKFTKSDHCLYGLVCVPHQSDGKLVVRFVDLKARGPIEEIEPIGE